MSLVGTPISTYRPSQNKCYLDFFCFMPCCQERLDISRAKHQLHNACTSGGPCADLAYSSWPNFGDKFTSGKVSVSKLPCYHVIVIYCMGMFLDIISTEFSIILGSAEKKTKKMTNEMNLKNKKQVIEGHFTAHDSTCFPTNCSKTPANHLVRHLGQASLSTAPAFVCEICVKTCQLQIMWGILKFELNGLILGSVWYSCCNSYQVPPLQLQD